jgi:hypothetical protein
VELTVQPSSSADASQVENPGVFLPRRRRFIVGCDLGQQSDPTAISVIERIDGVVDFNTAEERHTRTGRIPERKAPPRLDVRYLQRLPLKLSYPDQVERVRQLMARPPLSGVPSDDIQRATLIVDATGVGKPVAELFDRAGLKNEKISITSSEDKVTYSNGMWHVSKALLVQQIDACLHNAELRFAKDLAEAGAMAAELKDFRRFVSAAGRSTWEARSGQHDDLVLSVGLAVWWALRPAPPQPWYGFYGSKSERN